MYARKGEYHHIPTETKAADDDAQVDCKVKVGGGLLSQLFRSCSRFCEMHSHAHIFLISSM
jgi:hypothetical protein